MHYTGPCPFGYVARRTKVGVRCREPAVTTVGSAQTSAKLYTLIEDIRQDGDIFINQ